MTVLTASKLISRTHWIAVVFAVSLVAIYAIVPAVPEWFGIPARPNYMIAENAFGAAILALLLIGIGHLSRNTPVTRKPVPIHPAIAALVFLGGCFWLAEFSWIDVRSGFEGTISAVFRVLWFVIVINVSRRELKMANRVIYISATAVLMFLDQSRTYFLIALIILLIDLGWIATIPALVAGLVVAAVRSGQNDNLVYAIKFAIGGEGYLGSTGVFQVLSLGENGANFALPAVQALLAPATAIFTLFAKHLFDLPTEMVDSSAYLGQYIRFNTGEQYPPMGGFFILSEFIRAGWFGFVCLAAYMAIVYIVTKRLFDTVEFPIGSFIAILAIKSSPQTYWTLVISVFIVSYTMRRAQAVIPVWRKDYLSKRAHRGGFR